VSSPFVVQFGNPESILPKYFLHKDFYPFFAFKLGHFKAQTIFSYVTNTQPYKQTMENEEK
jgi:hypothetical protein